MKREREEEKINVEGAKAFKKQEISFFFFSYIFNFLSVSLSLLFPNSEIVTIEFS